MRQAAILLFGLAACSATTGPAGRFAGTVTPDKPGPLCAASKANLQIRDAHVIFAPDEGTWILDGVAGTDGTLTADKSRVAPNNQLYDTTFQGRLSGDTITGTYTTPRCTAKVTLTRR